MTELEKEQKRLQEITPALTKEDITARLAEYSLKNNINTKVDTAVFKGKAEYRLNQFEKKTDFLQNYNNLEEIKNRYIIQDNPAFGSSTKGITLPGGKRSKINTPFSGWSPNASDFGTFVDGKLVFKSKNEVKKILGYDDDNNETAISQDITGEILNQEAVQVLGWNVFNRTTNNERQIQHNLLSTIMPTNYYLPEKNVYDSGFMVNTDWESQSGEIDLGDQDSSTGEFTKTNWPASFRETTGDTTESLLGILNAPGKIVDYMFNTVGQEFAPDENTWNLSLDLFDSRGFFSTPVLEQLNLTASPYDGPKNPGVQVVANYSGEPITQTTKNHVLGINIPFVQEAFINDQTQKYINQVVEQKGQQAFVDEAVNNGLILLGPLDKELIKLQNEYAKLDPNIVNNNKKDLEDRIAKIIDSQGLGEEMLYDPFTGNVISYDKAKSENNVNVIAIYEESKNVAENTEVDHLELLLANAQAQVVALAKGFSETTMMSETSYGAYKDLSGIENVVGAIKNIQDSSGTTLRADKYWIGQTARTGVIPKQISLLPGKHPYATAFNDALNSYLILNRAYHVNRNPITSEKKGFGEALFASLVSYTNPTSSQQLTSQKSADVAMTFAESMKLSSGGFVDLDPEKLNEKVDQSISQMAGSGFIPLALFVGEIFATKKLSGGTVKKGMDAITNWAKSSPLFKSSFIYRNSVIINSKGFEEAAIFLVNDQVWRNPSASDRIATTKFAWSLGAGQGIASQLLKHIPVSRRFSTMLAALNNNKVTKNYPQKIIGSGTGAFSYVFAEALTDENFTMKTQADGTIVKRDWIDYTKHYLGEYYKMRMLGGKSIFEKNGLIASSRFEIRKMRGYNPIEVSNAATKVNFNESRIKEPDQNTINDLQNQKNEALKNLEYELTESDGLIKGKPGYEKAYKAKAKVIEENYDLLTTEAELNIAKESVKREDNSGMQITDAQIYVLTQKLLKGQALDNIDNNVLANLQGREALLKEKGIEGGNLKNLIERSTIIENILDENPKFKAPYGSKERLESYEFVNKAFEIGGELNRLKNLKIKTVEDEQKLEELELEHKKYQEGGEIYENVTEKLRVAREKAFDQDIDTSGEQANKVRKIIDSKEEFAKTYYELFPDGEKKDIENQPAFINPNTGIRYINKVAALEQGMTAVETHEKAHYAFIKDYKDDRGNITEKGIKIIDTVIDQLTPDQRKILEKEVASRYSDLFDGGKKTWYEENLSVLAELTKEKRIIIPRNIREKISDKLNLNKGSIKVNLETGQGIFKLLTKEGALDQRINEDARLQEINETQIKDAAFSSKATEAATDYKNELNKKGETPVLSDNFKNAFIKLALSKSGLNYSENSGSVERKEAVSFVLAELPGIMKRWNGKGEISTWISSNIRPKQQEFYGKQEQLAKKGVESSITDERVKNLIAENENYTLEERERAEKELEGKIIDPTKAFQLAQLNINKIKKDVNITKEDLAPFKADFNYLGKKFGVDVASTLYGITNNKLQNNANLTYAKKIIDGIPENSEAGRIQSDFRNIQEVKNFLKLLPLKNVSPKEAVDNFNRGEKVPLSRDTQGRSLGLTKRVIDFFYEENVGGERSSGESSQPFVRNLKSKYGDKAIITNETVKELQDAMGITPAGELNLYNRNIGTFLSGIAKLKGSIIANTLARQDVAKQDINVSRSERQLLADMGGGKRDAQFAAKGVKQDQINIIEREGQKPYSVETLEERQESVKRIMDLSEEGSWSKLFDIFGDSANLILQVVNYAPSGNTPSAMTKRGQLFINNRLDVREKDPKKRKQILAKINEIVEAGLIGEFKVIKDAYEVLLKSGKLSKTNPISAKNMQIASRKQQLSDIDKNVGDRNSHKEGSIDILNRFKEIYDKDPSTLALLQISLYNSNANFALYRNLAQIISKEALKKGDIYKTEEHLYQAGVWALRTLEAMTSKVDGVWEGWNRWQSENYWQIAIGKESQRLIDKTYDKYNSQFQEYFVLNESLNKAFKTGDFSKVPGPEIRMFNEVVKLNANRLGKFPGVSFAKDYNVEVNKKYWDNKLVTDEQAKLIYQQLLTKAGVLTGDNAVSAKQAKERIKEFLLVEPSKQNAMFSNSKTFGRKLESANTVEEQIKILGTYDKAVENARKLNAPVKKIRVFDFDDTLAKSKSNVLYEMPNGKTGKLNATEFAKRSEELESKGAIFDFTEFNKVIDGKKGPLFELAKRMNDAEGKRDIFVLTARPQASAQAIKNFLDGLGLKLPIENITGLENGSPSAKANWIVEKAAKGYNDFYFADDVMKNVKAVSDILNQIDVKSEVQQAKFSKAKIFDKIFNEIIESSTGIESYKEFSSSRAKTIGGKKGKVSFFTTPSAEDFSGLLYKTLGKGKVGDAQMEFFKDNLINPYNRAEMSVTEAKITAAENFKTLKNKLKTLPTSLSKQTGIGGFTYSQAARVAIWTKQGMKVPGLSKTDLKELNNFVAKNSEMNVFVDQLINIQKGKPYPKPGKEWLAGTITTDILGEINKVNRKEYLQEWQENVDIIFSEKNLNKLEAAYGSKYREALEDMLRRMKTGSNRPISGSRIVNEMMDWLNNSVGAIMFLNTRSAVLQTISSVNFINWGDNNLYKAGKAFANQPRFWKDFKTLMNSPYLTERRDGLKINVSESEIADAVMESKNKVTGGINYLLNKGFIFTRIADSFAIAAGGSTFYRNRIEALVKQGMERKAAEKQAFEDFYAIAEENQQSSNPSKISQQQASAAGRVILAFGNTPMQYNRIIKKATQDIINKRGDWKTNLSKIVYYAGIQNIIFNSLQNAVFAEAFQEDDDERTNKRLARTADGMSDSLLRGFGIQGALLSSLKDALVTIYKETNKEKGTPKYNKAIDDLLSFSPPLSSKLRKLKSAANTFSWNEKEMQEEGFSLNNPAYLAVANIISAGTNIPLDRAIKKMNNMRNVFNENTEAWQKVALTMGWSSWDVGLPYYGVEEKIEKTPSMIFDDKITELKKNTSTKEQKLTLLKLGLTRSEIGKLKYEEDRIKKILALEKKYENDPKTKDSIVEVNTRKIEVKALNKQEQVENLLDLGLTSEEIKKLKYESDRVNKIIELQNKKQ